MEADHMHGTFYGWYLKCQSDTQTLAIIPAIHGTGKKTTCSIQIITGNGAWNVPYHGSAFHRIECSTSNAVPKDIMIGKNRFGKNGISLSIRVPGLEVNGELDFGPLSPLKYDVMGPLSSVPFLECRHSVWSMRHSVSGTVYINEQKYTFWNARGYWEGDRGRSFPQSYAWTQCFFRGGSLMMSVADIPIMGLHINGVICIVLWHGKEYRLATYLGARVVGLQKGIIRIAQGNMVLEAKLYKPEKMSDAKRHSSNSGHQADRQQSGEQQSGAHPLKAPVMGDMDRIIHESVESSASYRFRKGGQTLFAFKSDRASFEYEYPD